MMEWIEPKTDWVESDFFNYYDYNRIRNNLMYLNDKCNIYFPPDFYFKWGEEKQVGDYVYAKEFNLFEEVLTSINYRAYRYDIGMEKSYFDLGMTIDYNELNRIEKACLRLYKMFEQIETKSRRVAFRANGTDFEDSGENEWQS